MRDGLGCRIFEGIEASRPGLDLGAVGSEECIRSSTVQHVIEEERPADGAWFNSRRGRVVMK